MEVLRLKKEKRVRYITSLERNAIQRGFEQAKEQGMEQGIEQGALLTTREAGIELLDLRFQPIPQELENLINSLTDVVALKQLLRDRLEIPFLDAETPSRKENAEKRLHSLSFFLCESLRLYALASKLTIFKQPLRQVVTAETLKEFERVAADVAAASVR